MFLEFPDQIRQNIWSDRGNCAHRQLAADLAFKVADASARIVDRAQNLPGVIDQTTPGFGQDD
ncbi:MAG: hypothetical protein DME71_00040 [Verrucomicrobia bacterium]|nr:MAG: hypothetical protein DME71_00040 [Verrucomicrobiota bacterium]